MDYNIMHEIIRRKKFNLMHRTFKEGGAEWYFKKDCTGNNAFMYFLEKAGFDVIL